MQEEHERLLAEAIRTIAELVRAPGEVIRIGLATQWLYLLPPELKRHAEQTVNDGALEAISAVKAPEPNDRYGRMSSRRMSRGG